MTLLVGDLVFKGDALGDIADVLLLDIKELTEGVVVCDWETDFLAVAVVQIVDVVLWEGDAVLLDELDTELLNEEE